MFCPRFTHEEAWQKTEDFLGGHETNAPTASGARAATVVHLLVCLRVPQTLTAQRSGIHSANFKQMPSSGWSFQHQCRRGDFCQHHIVLVSKDFQRSHAALSQVTCSRHRTPIYSSLSFHFNMIPSAGLHSGILMVDLSSCDSSASSTSEAMNTPRMHTRPSVGWPSAQYAKRGSSKPPQMKKGNHDRDASTRATGNCFEVRGL